MLLHRLFTSSGPMRNTETGFDMIYQENKVHNLKLAVSPYAADDHRTPRSQNKGFP